MTVQKHPIYFINIYSNLPVGVKYLAAYMMQYGYQVKILDCLEGHVDKCLEAVADAGKNAVFAFSCYTHRAQEVMRTAAYIKKVYPHSTVVFGNIHATIYYKMLLEENDWLDFVVLQEGELPLRAILKYLEGECSIKGLTNVAYRDKTGSVVRQGSDGKVVEIDSLPLFDVSGLFSSNNFYYISSLVFRRPWRIMKSLKSAVSLYTSRGCPMSCHYCSERVMTDGKWRAQSIDKTYDTLFGLYQKGVRHVYFLDPIFTCSRERIMRLCQRLKDVNWEMTWACQTHPSFLDPELVRTMAEAGCVYITVGIDCGHAKYMKRYRSAVIDLAKLKENIKVARQAGMFLKINVIVGWPEESIKDVFTLAKQLYGLHATHFSVFPLRYFPGTGLFEEAKAEGKVTSDYWRSSGKAFCNTHDLETGFARLKTFFSINFRKMVLDAYLLVGCQSVHGILFYLFNTIEVVFGKVFFLLSSLMRRRKSLVRHVKNVS